jgi:hypothetical protein
MVVGGECDEEIAEEGELRLADGVRGCRLDAKERLQDDELRKLADERSDLGLTATTEDPENLMDERLSFPRTPIL